MAQYWTIKDLLLWTTRYFSDRSIAAARLEAEILLAYALGKDRVFLYTHFDRPVNGEERLRFRGLIKRRASLEPLAYLIGEKEFMSLSFMVNSEVLIPRPETELLVETAINLCDRPNLSIIDIGTGSGAIAISLAHYVADVQVMAVDISRTALELARRNAQRHGTPIEFIHSDLFDQVDARWGFDIITANLPYISEKEYYSLDAGVRQYEPRQALLAGEDGLHLYRRLLPQAISRLNLEGCLLFEIGYNQGRSALEFAKHYGSSQLIVDGAGRDRLVVVRKDKSDDYPVLENQ